VLGECGVVDDYLGYAAGVGDACFLAFFVGVAGIWGALCCGESGWDGDMVEEVSGSFVCAVGDCFCGIDWTAAAYADESVD